MNREPRTTPITIIRQPEPLLLRRRDRLKAFVGRHDHRWCAIRLSILTLGVVVIAAFAVGLSVIALQSGGGASLTSDAQLQHLWSATPGSAIALLTVMVAVALASPEQPVWWPVAFALMVGLYWIIIGAVVWLAQLVGGQAMRRLSN